jgi:hypothetical protein
MTKEATKREGLEITLRKFDKSCKGPNDYIELLVVFLRAIKPDNGLAWSEVEEIIETITTEREALNMKDSPLDMYSVLQGKKQLIGEIDQWMNVGHSMQESVYQLKKMYFNTVEEFK